MWIRSCGICREAVARVVFSTITIRALIGYKQAWFTCNFCVLLFMSEMGKRRKVFECQVMLGKVARLRSIPSVNNSQARKFSLLSGKFSHSELLGFLLHFSKFLFLFFSCILSYICYIIYIINRLETCNYIYIYVHTGNKAHCNGQRMLNWRDLAVITETVVSMRSTSHFLHCSVLLLY